LSDLAERLDPAVFFRCHRSHIVNLRHVGEIERTAIRFTWCSPAGGVTDTGEPTMRASCGNCGFVREFAHTDRLST